MKRDNEKIKELIKMSEKNPELPIIPAVNYEVCAEDSGYWKGSFETVEKGYFYNKEDGTWKAGDKQDIIDEINIDLYEISDYEGLEDDDFDKIAEGYFDAYIQQGKIYEAIIVYIGLPK